MTRFVLMAVLLAASNTKSKPKPAQDPDSPILVSAWKGTYHIHAGQNAVIRFQKDAEMFHEASWSIQGSFVLERPTNDEGIRVGPGKDDKCASWSSHTESSAAAHGQYGVRPGPGIKQGYAVAGTTGGHSRSELSNHASFGLCTEKPNFDFHLVVEFDGRLLNDSSEYIGKIKAATGQPKEDPLQLAKAFEALALSAVPPDSKPFTPQFEFSFDDVPFTPGAKSFRSERKVKIHLSEIMGPPIEATVSFTLEPAKDYANIEIVKLEQAGGPRTSNRSDVVFQNGKLELVAEARVSPPDLAGQVEWKPPTIEDIEPVVREESSPGIARVRITYPRLPASNDSFGEKRLEARLKTSRVGRSFRTFFDRDGTDHPRGSAAGGDSWPNWFFYWRQGPVPKLDSFEFERNPAMGGGYNPLTKRLVATESAPDSIPGINRMLVTKDGEHRYQLRRDSVKGIQAVAAIVAHELRHKLLHEQVTPGSDNDEDAVIDASEPRFQASPYGPWLDVFQPNTYDNFNVDLFYGNVGQWVNAGTTDEEKAKRQKMTEEHRGQLKVKGDNELLAIIAEKDREADESADWAFPGSQAR